jgi:general secretion pathway protein I
MSRSLSERASRRDRNGGFTLIEVLVAFAILAISLTALFQIFSAGTRNIDTTQAYTTAILLAESNLARVGREVPLRESEEAGEWKNGFRWKRTIRPYDDVPIPDSLSVRLFLIAVTVSWGELDKERTISLETLRLSARS